MVCSKRAVRMRNFLPVALLLIGAPCFAIAEISITRQAELHHLLKHDCGSCHGMTLKGGLGPALTNDVLAGKSRLMLLTTILEGRPGTPMPPWKTLLTHEEASWLVDILLQGKTDVL